MDGLLFRLEREGGSRSGAKPGVLGGVENTSTSGDKIDGMERSESLGVEWRCVEVDFECTAPKLRRLYIGSVC